MAEPEIDQLLSALQGVSEGGSEEQLRALSPCEQCLTGPLPEPLESWGRALRSALTPIAHRWKSDVGHSRLFSSSASVKSVCEPPALHARLSYLFADQMQALGHDAARGEAFPIQMVVLLSEPDRDFVGGEFVIADQRPRMHSRPMVIPLNKGDAALIAASQRPVKGRSGVCHMTLRHGVSRVRSGSRIGLELFLG
ncbi:2OG-Fe(II) oxygenase [Pseudomonas sp. RC10]|uniref:2OG-Fe(II) oxygenase n=1 Tax=Pseudomonas bambusae TaxID=3139142 RepID=UPI0031391A0C